MVRLLLITLGVCACLPGAETWRPTITAVNWAVASGNTETAMAAAQILARGGNAIDAAVAASFAASVVQPGNTGIGGHAMVMIYRAGTGQVSCVDGSGWSGRRATLERFAQHKGGLPAEGPLAPTVPGFVEALLRAWEQHGRLPRAAVLEPAIQLADRGFVISPFLASQLRASRDRLAQFESTRRQWLPGGEPPAPGTLVRQPDLAGTLRTIAARGRDGFYRGPVAARVVAYLRQAGGILEEDDFAEYSARAGAPLHAGYRGFELYEGPAWSFDHIGLETLNILEGFDLKAMGHLSADYIHHVTEAMKLAFADRDRSVADPSFPDRMPELVAKDFARRRRALIRAGQAREPDAHIGAGGNTDFVAVIDGERNMVSITSSVSAGFGNLMYVDGAGGGFFLNNWMPLFRLDPAHANRLEPRKVPRTGWSPMLALKDGKPYAAFGTPGGDTIAQAQLQFFIHLADFGMDVQQALEQPWFRTEAFEAYRYPNATGKNLVLSERIARPVQAELARRGHAVTTHQLPGIGSVRAVVIDPRSGMLLAGAAPGSDAYALGW
jgi:gamma-glutamyltranspeptidase / glutathione hydrolase